MHNNYPNTISELEELKSKYDDRFYLAMFFLVLLALVTSLFFAMGGFWAGETLNVEFIALFLI